MKKTVTVVVSMLTISALLLAGCTRESKPKTVESIVNSNEDVAETIQKGASDSGVEVDIKDNTITYSFDISNAEGFTEEMLDSDDFIKSIETSQDSQKSFLGGICKSIEEKTGIEGVTIKVIYTRGDKEVITSTVTSADASDEAPAETDEE